MPNFTQEYTVIAIYSGKAEGAGAISSIDGVPGYLHIHIIRKDQLSKIPLLDMSSIGGCHESKTIYQWGAPIDKDLGIRKPLAPLSDMLKYGNIGIGSAAAGGDEAHSSFVGGGEVFILPCSEGVKAFRVTKGQGVFPLSLDDKCWSCEITNNNEALVIPIGRLNISSRSDLLAMLQNVHGQSEDMPFVAQFDAHFDKDYLAVRSNGLCPDDIVGKRGQALFNAERNDPIGGHLLGDSNSVGDQLRKHQGEAPAGGAKLSLAMVGVLQITLIQKRLIALKESPYQFREPLLQADLKSALERHHNRHIPILINGGGVAGVTTALKLAKLGVPCTIIDQKESLLSGASGCTPARVGHGYHYRDLPTSILYLQCSITFLKEYCGGPDQRSRFIIGLNSDNPENDCGLYFIRKDTQFPKEKLLEVYDGIRAEYKRLVELDPSNKIFGEVEDFFQILKLEDYQDMVDISKMDVVLRTQERLLNWSEFSNHILQQVELCKQQGLITVITGLEVTKIEYDEKSRNREFKITINGREELTASHVVNATWANIEKLDDVLFPEVATEKRTNRMKMIVSIMLPEDKQHIPSMFTTMGPYAMFSNEGGGRGKATYAPVTNVLDYVIEEYKKVDSSTFDYQIREICNKWVVTGEVIVENVNNPESWRKIECQLTIPPLYKRWLANGLSPQEQLVFGSRILAGVIETYPILAGSRISNVAGGIVKSNGEVNIRKADSKFHERCDHGLKPRQIGYSDFNGMKLFYSESQGRDVAWKVLNDIRLNSLIEKRMVESDGMQGRQREYMMNSYVRRYADQRSLGDGGFWPLRSKAGIDIANQSVVNYMGKFLRSMLTLYLEEPKITLNAVVPFVGKMLKSVGDAVKVILEDKEVGSKGWKIEEQHQKIEHSLVANRCPKTFTVFSIINSEGDIVSDSRYGDMDYAERQRQGTPSLKDRDYVQQMLRGREAEIICGAPVIGSTSQEFMIPVGIRLNEDYCLTFGMRVEGLMQTIPLRQVGGVS